VHLLLSVLGHASAAMTIDVYAGLFGDGLDAVADRLDEAAARWCGQFADYSPLGRRCCTRARRPKYLVNCGFAW